MNSGVKHINDILKEVAKEEGMSVRAIKDVWKHQLKYTKDQMDNPDVFSIFLPYLGHLSLNVKAFTAHLSGINKKTQPDLIDKVERLKNHENYGMYENAHKRVNASNRLGRMIIRNYQTGIYNSKRLLKDTFCWPLIQKYSNGFLEKRDKPYTKQELKELRYEEINIHDEIA